MFNTILSACAFLSAATYLYAYWQDKSILKYVFKPLTMLFIIALAMINTSSVFGLWILIGLSFSVIGDIFLMLPKDRFLHGLISFFLAHVCYVVALLQLGTDQLHRSASIALLILAALFCLLIASSVKKYGGVRLLLAVFLYIAIITGMTILGVSSGNPLLIVAALLFLLSDAILAVNRFLVRFAASQYLIMSTYYTAQYLFALSVIGL
jgi:uncharacterized membrane protein YhhN